MKKRILSVLFCCLICAGLALPSSAASKGKMSLSGALATPERGDDIELTVELNRNPGVKTLRCTVGFDPMVLEFVGAEGTKTLPNFTFETYEGSVLLRWNSDGNTTATGAVATLALRVRKDAIYGDSAVTLSVSERLYDAQNEKGEAVPFDTAGMKFVLPCPHENPEVSVEQEASFETEGILKETCTACGNVTVKPLPPIIKSADGRVEVTLSVGEFSADDVVEVALVDLYATEEEENTRALLGEDLFYTFRIRFTKNGEAYIPGKDCTVRLTSDFPLPEGTVLYSPVEGGTVQPETEITGRTLRFPYDDAVFALVARPPHEEPVIPSVTTTPVTEPPTSSTLSSMEQDRRKDLILIGAGVAVLLFCGTGTVLILGRRKRF